MFTEEEWRKFLEYFERLKKTCGSRGINVEYSRETGKVLYKRRDGETFGRQSIRNILRTLPRTRAARRQKEEKT